ARALLAWPEIRRARDYLAADDARVLREQRELTEIPAPPFGDTARARRMAELFAQAGLSEVETDEEGNVLARLPGVGGGDASASPLVVSAHLDTVFPEGTPVIVREEDGRLIGPGISDDGRGLAALLGLARVMTQVLPPGSGGPLLFVATVGEEGAGDLRGVRHLFRPGGPAREARGFIS